MSGLDIGSASRAARSVAKRLVPAPALEWLKRAIPARHKIGKHEIVLPRDHSLPSFQATYPLYDQFIPVLCSVLPEPDKWVVDVGANIGDTAVAAAQNCANPIMSVEATSYFYSFLSRNIERCGLTSRVRAVKAIVGTGRYSGSMAISGNTSSRLVRTEGPPVTTDLNSLVPDASKVILLKTDTDGFDADVLRSADKILEQSRPLLFWENYFSEDFQRRDLEQLYDWLSSLGYTHAWVFSNFGELVHSDVPLSALVGVNDALEAQRMKGGYVDVFAACDNNLAVAREAAAKFARLYKA